MTNTYYDAASSDIIPTVSSGKQNDILRPTAAEKSAADKSKTAKRKSDDGIVDNRATDTIKGKAIYMCVTSFYLRNICSSCF
jgi:hypothetical protein